MRSHWYPIMLQLHRFMIAVARVTVNHDGEGGTAPDPLVWDQGGRKKSRKTDICCSRGCFTGADIAAWPYSAGISCKFTAFLSSLHWPVDAVDLGILVFPFWSF